MLVLFPRLDFALRHVAHVLDWDRAIDPSLAEMPAINREIDATLAAPRPRKIDPRALPLHEVAAVQAWVDKRIPYRRDWFTWGNIDYWPTAAETLTRGTEDCDGRAILAVSILRARGFTTARLAMNWAHMWAVVEPHDPRLVAAGRKVERPVGLMNPMGAETVRREGGRVRLLAVDWEVVRLTLLEASLFPAWRAFLIVAAALVLIFHPCRNWRRLLLPLVLALAAHISFLDWAARTAGVGGEVSPASLGAAAVLLIAAFLCAALAERREGRPSQLLVVSR